MRERVALIDASGAGKSTLLNTAMGWVLRRGELLNLVTAIERADWLG